jgi:hypothetical protein
MAEGDMLQDLDAGDVLSSRHSSLTRRSDGAGADRVHAGPWCHDGLSD